MLKKIINIIIILIIIAIIVFAGIFAYDFFRKIDTEEDTEEIDVVMQEINNYVDEYIATQVQQTQETDNNTNTPGTSNTTTNKKITEIKISNYTILGKVVINKLNLSYPIIDDNSPDALKKSIIKQYGVNPNEYGNMVLAGHNYRNGTMFGNLKLLNVGDKVKIVNLSGDTIEYIVYDKYETTGSDTAHYAQDKSIRHVVLTTCSSNGQKRLVVKCKQK